MPAESRNRMGWLDWTLLVVLSVLWGGSFFFTKIALAALPPLTLVLLRVGIAALALLLFFLLSGGSMRTFLRIPGALICMGLLNNVIPFSLLSWGQVHITGSLASILNAFVPVFTILLAHFLTHDEKMTVNKVAGVGLGVSGVVLMVGSSALEGIGPAFLGMLACLGATLAYAFATIYGKRFRELGVRPIAVASGQVCMSTAMMIPIVMVVDRPWNLGFPPLDVTISVVMLGILSTALAYILFFRILSSGGATNMSLVALLIPASAMLLGVGILGEQIHDRDLAGLGLIVSGLVCMDGRVFRRGRLAGHYRGTSSTSK